jgi:predicted alpha/beta-fold hydrolase
VDDYYEHASSDQRLGLVDVPLLLVNAVDDPIAYLGERGNLRLPPALQVCVCVCVCVFVCVCVWCVPS